MTPELAVAACVLAAVLFAGLGACLVLRFLKKLAVAMAYAAAFPPVRVALTEATLDEAEDPEALEAAAEALQALGYTRTGLWVVDELDGVVILGLVHPEEHLLAAVMEHPAVGLIVDVVAQGSEGQVLTVTTTEEGALLRSPPFKTSVHVRDAEPAALHARAKDELRRLGWRPAPPGEGFVAAFEAGWAREIAWQCARGGPTREEIAAHAARMESSLDEAQLEKAWRALHEAALDGLEDLLRLEVEALAERMPDHLDDVDPDDLIFVHEVYTREELQERLGFWVGDETTVLPPGDSNRHVFGQVMARVPLDMRLRHVGSLEEPVPTEVWTWPADGPEPTEAESWPSRRGS